jgi:hypothetical protein
MLHAKVARRHGRDGRADHEVAQDEVDPKRETVAEHDQLGRREPQHRAGRHDQRDKQAQTITTKRSRKRIETLEPSAAQVQQDDVAERDPLDEKRDKGQIDPQRLSAHAGEGHDEGE